MRGDNKPYKCPHCVKAFANNSYLAQHMRIHLGIKPFGPCQFCNKKFTQLSHLQQHIRTHTGEKPYKCKIAGCDKSFSQLSNLQSHSRCHQSDKPFKCNSCYKCFNDETALLEHIPKHKESKHLKVHICSFCGKSYTQALYLEKHMAKHADRPRFTKYSNYSDFSAESIEGLNQLNNFNQLNNLGQNSLISGSFQQIAASAAAVATSSSSAQPNNGQALTANLVQANGTNGTSNANNNQNNPTSAATVTVAASYGYSNITNQAANQMIGNSMNPLEFFHRSFQQRENVQVRVNGQDRPAGFNMITPLENIKTFNQNNAATAGFNNCA
ncbi:unnamed protein product [Bursaphelenchus xylophilus]|nr:unnamed protein product [Bursaphelenchus xylophilus]CAG9100328.1 unnamed protein product [Bursaphelenchus xylophilus]